MTGEARRRVWIALADLFLDTDVRMSYPFIARVLAESPYTLAELRDILDREVTPALQSNLLEVAGEWAAFDDEWVVREIERIAQGDPPRVEVDVTHHWAALSKLAERLRLLPEGEARMEHCKLWNRLLRLILDRRPQVERPAGVPVPALEAIFRMELLPALIDSVRRLAKRNPTIYPSEAEVEENWRRFAE